MPTLPGTPILEDQFADLRLVVEVAWGAGPGPDPGVWTDITADLDGPVAITPGRIDEASQTQPATCALLLKSPGGRYFKGPQSPNFPNIRRGTPVRVRAVLDGVSFTRFYGYADSWTPVFDDAQVHPQVILAASGTLRRLNKGQPLRSTLYRTYTQATGPTAPVAYWPCEEGADSKIIASGLPGAPNMILSGFPTFARDTSFPCSAALPQLAGTSWTGSIPASTGPDNVLRFLLSIPSTGAPNNAVLARLYTSGTCARMDLVYQTGGWLGLYGYTAAGVQLFFTGFTLDQYGLYFGADGVPLMISLEAHPDGAGNINYTAYTLPLINVFGIDYTSFPFTPYGGGFSPVAGAAVGAATRVVINPNGTLTDTAIGHIVYQSTTDIVGLQVGHQFNAWTLEAATDRLIRLCAEQGDPINAVAGAALMGFQGVDTYINLLRQAETVDGGVLYDGFDPGLTYVSGAARQNLTATLTLDAAAGDVQLTAPVDDDQRIVNVFTASRVGGATATVSDTTSPLAVDVIGPNPGSLTINISNDSMLADYAAWQVHLGTVDAYRWPTLPLRFHGKQGPRLLPGWLATQITSRIDVLNIAEVLPGLDPRPVSVIAEGWSETIDKFTWDVTVNASPYDPWRVGHLATGVSDFSEGVLRLESDGSTTVGAAAAGAVTLSVATPSGPLWTTDPAEFPIEFDVGGIHVTATAISGASSPQTFTVSPVSMRIPADATVRIWNPGYIGRF